MAFARAVVGIKGAGAVGKRHHAGDADGSMGRGRKCTKTGPGQQRFTKYAQRGRPLLGRAVGGLRMRPRLQQNDAIFYHCNFIH